MKIKEFWKENETGKMYMLTSEDVKKEINENQMGRLSLSWEYHDLKFRKDRGGQVIYSFIDKSEVKLTNLLGDYIDDFNIKYEPVKTNIKRFNASIHLKLDEFIDSVEEQGRTFNKTQKNDKIEVVVFNKNSVESVRLFDENGNFVS
jgi:hypothetical protein